VKNTRFAIIPLFLTIFVDALGMGLVFPLLTPLFIDTNSVLFDSSILSSTRHLLFGLLLAIYPLMTFLGSPWLGTLSDKYGRKSVLIICMIGNGLGLFMMGAGVAAGSVAFILCGRLIAGLTAASLPIAQAAMIDRSTPETKSKYMSIITAANAIGFSLGPVLSGVLLHSSLLLSSSTIFLIISTLPFLIAILIFYLFQESRKASKDVKINLWNVLSHIYIVFKARETKKTSFTFLLFLLGYYVAFNYFSTYFIIGIGLKETEVFSLLTYYSAWSAIALLFIIPFLAKKLTTQQNLLLSTALQPMILICMIVFAHSAVFWITLAPFAIFVANGYVTLLTIFSNATPPEHQGKIVSSVT